LKWFRLQYPGLAKILFAVPNGGLRTRIEAKILIGEGVVHGVSDCILLKSNHQYSSLCIEFKAPGCKQTELQKSWQELVEKHGNKYIVCTSFDEFRQEIQSYLLTT
jgi:hypothetical protein